MNHKPQPPVKKQCPYRLSVVMIVKNEAENLKISLPAIVGWVDEIIVLDSGSNDNSEVIAKQYGAQWFVNTDWQGFGKQRQIAQSYATGDWVLALDADEEVSPELKDSILSVTKEKPDSIVYGLRNIDFIWGHAIDPRRWIIPIKAHWRLYPNTYCFNSNAVHESVSLNGATTATLAGYVHHHTAQTPFFWLKKRLDYAITWANEGYQNGKKVNIFTVLLHMLGAFIKQYFVYGRFLKGKYGFIYACLFMQYTFNKYAILYDLNRKQKIREKNE